MDAFLLGIRVSKIECHAKRATIGFEKNRQRLLVPAGAPPR